MRIVPYNSRHPTSITSRNQIRLSSVHKMPPFLLQEGSLLASMFYVPLGTGAVQVQRQDLAISNTTISTILDRSTGIVVGILASAYPYVTINVDPVYIPQQQ